MRLSDMRLLLDVDGVLCDLLGHWLKQLEISTGVSCQESEVTHWEIERAKPFADAGVGAKEIYAPLKDPAFWKTAWVMPGAREFIREVKAIGVEAVAVTSPANSTSSAEKFEWLARVFPGLPTIVTEHKHMISGDILVDDRIDNLVKWRKHNPRGYCIAPWYSYTDTRFKELGHEALSALIHSLGVPSGKDSSFFPELLKVVTYRMNPTDYMENDE